MIFTGRKDSTCSIRCRENENIMENTDCDLLEDDESYIVMDFYILNV
jgi:hypothetical protein